jgi:UDP-N-acetylmuramoyl-tripeptide--D-alanyl-D-alanine ligase
VIPLPVDELRGLGELRADADVITGVEIDSRRVRDGDLFVAVGRGVDFVDDARANGASATLVPREAFAAMAAIGRAVRDRSDATVVGITGSTGKTSTKDILAALCRPVARTVAAESGHNNEIGLPLTLTRIEPDTQVVICEMGMRGLGQIRELCEIARPSIAIVTSIGPVHLELLGTVERVARAKAEILEALPPGGVAILPSAHDAPELERFVPEHVDVRRFTPVDAEIRDGRAHVRVLGREVVFEFAARHQARNAAAALLAVDALGLPFPDEPVEVAFSRWRGDESPLPGGGLLINDAYNANPISMRAALEYLVERADGRRTVAILGEMAELGAGSPSFHVAVAEHARALGVDVLVGVGEAARDYAPDAWVADARDAAELVEPGDAVLVKASRAAGLEIVADALTGVPAP